MATQLQIRRGTASQIAAFTGAEGEVVVNTTNDSIVVSDGSTAGGFEQARADLNNVSDASLNAALTGNTVSALTITTLTLGSTAITATGAEINILDGVTATAAELNILDGVTSTTAELNILDGVTSAIQTQLDAKAPLASPTFTGTVNAAALTVDTTTLVVDATNNTVGIGNSSPSDFFATANNLVVGSGSGSEGITVYSANDSIGNLFFADGTSGTAEYSGYLEYSHADDSFRIGTGGSERMRLTGGNVGIGTSSPLSILHIGSGADANVPITIAPASGGNAEFRSTTSTGSFTFTNGNGSNERMRITSAGLVGIGVSAPSRALEVSTDGTAQFRLSRVDSTINGGNTIGTIEFMGTDDTSGTVGATIVALANTTWGAGAYPCDLAFSTMAGSTLSERMRIDTSGNVLVGKTSTGTAQGFEAQQDGEVYSSIVNGLNTYHVYANAAYRFYVAPNGGIYNFSANNVNLSDEREKKNIEALESQWGSLKQWSLKKFHFNADADSDTKKLGVIAQEVETHNPEVVSEFNVNENTIRMAVKEQQMMWMAIKALQEAQERIETLETKVQTLENN